MATNAVTVQKIFEYKTPGGEKPRFITPVALPDGNDVILVYVFLTGYASSTRIQVRRVRVDGTWSTIVDKTVQTTVPLSKEDHCAAIRKPGTKDLYVFITSHPVDTEAYMERATITNVFLT